MSDDKVDQVSGKSMLSAIMGEIDKSKRDQVKKVVKELVNDYLKAQVVVDGIRDKIVAELSSVGETEATVREFLND